MHESEYAVYSTVLSSRGILCPITMQRKNSRVSAFINRASRQLWAWFGTSHFFYAAITVFVLQAGWVAASGAYSMAFDEYYHYGLINLYAQQWSPFITQPDGPAVFGAVAQDPSYMYHYMFSFPFRLLALFTSNQTIQIIVMRLANIGLFVAALFIYRELLWRLGLSKRSGQIIVVFSTLLPVSVQLAAQLNYDNAQFLLVGAVLYTASGCLVRLRQNGFIEMLHIIWLSSLIMLGCLVKFTFLPFAVTVIIFMAIILVKSWFRRPKELPSVLRLGHSLWSVRGLLSLFVLGVLAVAIAQRYGVNIVRYQSPAPRCDVVLSKNDCLAYDPYRRDAGFRQSKYHEVLDYKDKLNYPFRWFEQMIWEAYIVVGNRQSGYPVGRPLVAAYSTGHIIAYGMLAVWLLCLRRVWRFGTDALRLTIVVVVVYAAILFVRNYGDFIRTGVPVAIHARYFIPVFPLIAAVVVVALHSFNTRIVMVRQKVVVLTIIALLVTYWGGGIVPFVVRSDDSWMWPHAVKPNQTLRSIIEPVVID